MALDTLKGQNVDAKLWQKITDIESSALDQIKNVCKLPWVFHHAAIMADVHAGVGCTIGSCIATKNSVSPSLVGVDIGCGVSAIKTSLYANDLPDDLSTLRHAIERGIPVGNHGFSEHKDPLKEVEKLPLWKELSKCSEKAQSLKSKALRQCGSLGGGNHFIELCLDTDNNVWIMLHSGSRNFGKTIAEMHINIAKRLTHNLDLEDRDLAAFLSNTPEMQAYRTDLYFAQNYALANRTAMINIYKKQLQHYFPQVTFEEEIKCHHNYVAEEIHYGEKVFVTRKGAINASKGVMGIIPGCLGANTRVLMANGLYKNIVDIEVGEKLINGNGSIATVINKFERGKKICWKYRNNNFHSETEITPDHKHYIGNYSAVSFFDKRGRVEALEHKKSQYEWRSLDDMPNNFEKLNGSSMPNGFTLLFPKVINFDAKENFEVNVGNWKLVSDYKFGYIVGTFAGDGTAYYSKKKGGQVSWSFGKEEQDIANKLKDILESVFGLKAKIYRDKKDLFIVVIHNAILGQFFNKFGKEPNKVIPEELWSKNKEYLRGVYDGIIDSDGHLNNKTDKFTNTSKVLIEQFGISHFVVHGYLPSVSYREPSAGGLENCNIENCNPSYRSTSLRLPPLTSEHQCIELLHVDKNPFEIETYDLEINTDDHSFIANNVIVHNSMGTRSYIVEGLGNPESFESAPHGAGRRMSRGEAKRRFSKKDLEEQTAGVECRKDEGVIDEIPAAYKNIDDVIENSKDLVKVKHILKQVMCIKG